MRGNSHVRFGERGDETRRPQGRKVRLAPTLRAPRGAVWQYPNGRKGVRQTPVGSAMYLNMAEANSAGRG
jgi:hypothetical protein